MVGQLIAQLERINGARFASFIYSAKGTGETAKYRARLGVNVENVYRADVSMLRTLLADSTPGSLEHQAISDVLASMEKSLEVGIGNNPMYSHGGNDPTYVSLPGVPGVKIHRTTGAVHLLCMVDDKVTLTPGVHKKVNSAPLTIEKNRIRKMLRVGKIRQFVLTNVERAALNGEVLEII